MRVAYYAIFVSSFAAGVLYDGFELSDVSLFIGMVGGILISEGVRFLCWYRR